MRRFFPNSLLILLFMASFAWPQTAREDRSATGSKGLVVSGNALSTAAGIKILEKGGNAADAGAATLLALSVTYVGAFCVGGEVPIMVYNSEKNDVKVLSGQGGAPLDAKAIEWYMQHGIPDGEVKAAAVPATVDAVVTLLKICGTRSFEEVVQPTLEILDAGGPTWYIDTGSRRRIETGVHWQADMATTFRKMVESERQAKGTREQRLQAVSDRFYRGDIADDLERWYIEKGGFLRKADLAAHRTRVEDPLLVDYRGYTVYKCGPWTQGPYLLETLRLLEGYNLKDMGFQSADYIHTVTEAMKLALADRDEYYGDPNFVKVPMRELLSDQYTTIRRPLIDAGKASLELRPGDPYRMQPLKTPGPTQPAHGGTTVMCVKDRWGNLIAATPSGLSSTAGVAGKTGIIHGAHMQDQAAIQLILEYVDFGITGEAAFKAPRFSTNHFVSSFGQGRARLGSLQVNSALPDDVQADLKRRGHNTTVGRGAVGGVALIAIEPGAKSAVAVGPAAASLN